MRRARATSRRHAPRRWRYATIPGCALALLLLTGAPSAAGPPTEALRAALQEAHRIYQEPASRAQLAAVMVAHFDRVFDLSGAAQRALGDEWPARTPAERGEYSRLFAALVKHAYLARMASAVDGLGHLRVNYLAEAVEHDSAFVRTVIASKSGGPVPMTYEMALIKGRWMVRDVNVEGISLVGNYRAQFRRILRDSSYWGLIARMHARIGDTAGAAQAAPGGSEAIGPRGARPLGRAPAPPGSAGDVAESDPSAAGRPVQTP